LAGKSLPEAVAALARAFTSETGVRVHMRVVGERPLPFRTESELFRIIQEGLANIRRHASASEVALTLRLQPDRVRLTLRDNGRGFDRRAAGSGRHGIVGMRERARLIGGRLRVGGRPGIGTMVSVNVPLPGEGPA